MITVHRNRLLQTCNIYMLTRHLQIKPRAPASWTRRSHVFHLRFLRQYGANMMDTAGVCGMEAATRGLVEGSSSPPASVTPSEDNLGDFGGLITTCCNDEVRGETPGREDCRIDLPEGELDSRGDQNKDQNMFGGCCD